MEDVSEALPDTARRIDSAIELDDDEMLAGSDDKTRQQADGSCDGMEVTRCVNSPVKTSLKSESPGKDQAVSSVDEEPLILQIGTGSDQPISEASEALSKSPTLTQKNLYEEAYWKDVARIREDRRDSIYPT